MSSLSKYKRVPVDVLNEPEDHYLFQLVFEHMAGILGSKIYEKNPADSDTFPREANTILSLWWLSCEVNGNGFESYLLQSSAIELLAAYEALKTVGAHELVAFFEAGVCLAESSADFATDEDAERLVAIGRPSKYVELQELDIAAAPHISDPFSSLVASYIRSQGNVL